MKDAPWSLHPIRRHTLLVLWNSMCSLLLHGQGVSCVICWHGHYWGLGAGVLSCKYMRCRHGRGRRIISNRSSSQCL